MELQGNQLLAKIHDWDLDANDYPAIRKLLSRYNNKAWDYIKKNNVIVSEDLENKLYYYTGTK